MIKHNISTNIFEILTKASAIGKYEKKFRKMIRTFR